MIFLSPLSRENRTASVVTSPRIRVSKLDSPGLGLAKFNLPADKVEIKFAAGAKLTDAERRGLEKAGWLKPKSTKETPSKSSKSSRADASSVKSSEHRHDENGEAASPVKRRTPRSLRSYASSVTTSEGGYSTSGYDGDFELSDTSSVTSRHSQRSRRSSNSHFRPAVPAHTEPQDGNFDLETVSEDWSGDEADEDFAGSGAVTPTPQTTSLREAVLAAERHVIHGMRNPTQFHGQYSRNP